MLGGRTARHAAGGGEAAAEHGAVKQGEGAGVGCRREETTKGRRIHVVTYETRPEEKNQEKSGDEEEGGGGGLIIAEERGLAWMPPHDPGIRKCPVATAAPAPLPRKERDLNREPPYPRRYM